MTGVVSPPGRSIGRRAGGRMFEQGDLRYVVLRLLEEKPRHGYDIIKALEERFGGAYAPSPGVVYPTLRVLEELGHARAVPGPARKKVYEITDDGRAHLAVNRRTVDGIFERINTLMTQFLDEPITAVRGALERIGTATHLRASDANQNPALLRRIAEILERATGEIDALGG